MSALTKSAIALALLACAGCAKPSDISEARRDHLLAGPHGWLDVTVHAPAAPASTASAPVQVAVTPNGKDAPLKPADVRSGDCRLEFIVNGEVMMADDGNLARADAAGNPLGYRFPVPAGTLDSELHISSCVENPLQVKLPLTQGKDQLSLLEFDGKALALKSVQPYAPATLDTVHADVARLHDRGDATDGMLANLRRLVFASIILNLVVLGMLFRRRRRKSRKAE